MSYPVLLLPLQQATADLYLCRRHSSTLQAPCLWNLWVLVHTRFEPSEHLWGVWGLILNVILPLLPSCWGFSFAVGWGVSFLDGIQHSPVDGCSAASCNFGTLAVLHHLLVNLEILKTQQWPQDWKRSVFIPIPKKGNAKECSNYHTIALISHASKVMLKILQARLQKWTMNFQKFKLDLEKTEGSEIKLPTSAGSWKKQESSRKTSISALLTMPKPLTVWITINCGKFWDWWEYQTSLLRNLYAG